MVTILDFHLTTKKLDQYKLTEGFKLEHGHKYWIDVEGTTELDLKRIAALLSVHPLTFENLIEQQHLPKVELFEEYLFILVLSLHPTQRKLAELDKTLPFTELNIFYGKNFIVTLHEDPLPSIAQAKVVVEKNAALWGHSLAHMLYRIIDLFVADYLPTLEELQRHVDRISEEAFINPTNTFIKRLMNTRRRVLSYRRVIMPQREMFGRLSFVESEWVEKGSMVYVRDLYHHMVRLLDRTDAILEELDNAFNAYTSLNANKLNEVMKTLTLFAAIVLPLTLITGIYGMNFKFMPEIDHPFGYPIVIGVMIAVAVGLLYYFKRKRWM